MLILNCLATVLHIFFYHYAIVLQHCCKCVHALSPRNAHFLTFLFIKLVSLLVLVYHCSHNSKLCFMLDSNFYLYNLKLTPTYSVLYKQRRPSYTNKLPSVSNEEATKSTAQIENEKNLQENEHKGFLSAKATKQLKLSVNWLLSSSDWQTINVGKDSRRFSFKVNFITLTLPSKQNEIPDQLVKKELLNPFLMILKNRYDFHNYVWKAEAQENGNIHFHIVSNCYIPHDELRFLWNRLLLKKNYMTSYTEKFKQMSLRDYHEFNNKHYSTSFDISKRRFLYGKSTSWKNPNSTDIHSVKHVKDIGAYIATYMSKKDTERRGIDGRIWSCSYSLSAKNKCFVEFEQHELNEVYDIYNDVSDKIFEVFAATENEHNGLHIATVFYHSTSTLKNINISTVKKSYKNHLLNIRESPDILSLDVASAIN